MPGQLTIPTGDFAQAMREYLKVTRKTVCEALNAKAGDVAYRAEKFQPRALQPAIQKQLWRLVPSKRYPKRPTPWIYHVINHYRKTGVNWGLGIIPKWMIEQVGTGPPLFDNAMSIVAQHYFRSKKASTAYIAVGWLMVARFFGKKISIAKLSAKGWAFHSDGMKATPQHLTATLRNFARGADKAPGSLQALEKALASVVDDMFEHIIDEMLKRWLNPKASASSRMALAP